MLANRLSHKIKDFTVVCANSQKSLFIAGMAAFFARKPFIWILHDIVTDKSFSPTARKGTILFANLMCRTVVANSEATATAFKQAGGRPELIRIVYNGFDPAAHPQASPDASQKVRRLFGMDDRPIIATFARLSRWKGQHILLRALAKVPNAQALIIGGALFGEEAYEHELHRLARELGIETRIRITGARDDVAELMAGVDIVACPSIVTESFGRSAVEGMLAKRPVIAVGTGGTLEVIQDKVTGYLIPPNDAEALARTILTILAAPAEAGHIAVEGQRSALARFQIDVTCRNMAHVLGQIARLND
jgi:glycosyltransferase involved in cell wall biosynthesis